MNLQLFEEEDKWLGKEGIKQFGGEDLLLEEKILRVLGKHLDGLLQLSLFVRNDLIAYKLLVYSVLSRIETFWVRTALAFCATHSMLLFSIPSHPWDI